MKRTARSFDRLHHAPDQADLALVLIDVVNDLEFDGGENLLTHALPMARALAALKRRTMGRPRTPVLSRRQEFDFDRNRGRHLRAV
jgi:hypothetical protein